MPSSTEQRTASLLAVAVVAAVALYASPYFPALNNPNETVRVQMTAALWDHGTYRIDEVRARWGFTNDAACVDRAPDGTRHPCQGPGPLPGVTRELYSVKAPLGSVLGVPAYALARRLHGPGITQAQATRACRIGGALLPCLGLLYLLRRYFAREIGDRLARDAAFYAVAIGSVGLGYSLLFVSHTLSGLTAFGAFALLDEARRRRSIGVGHAMAAGFLASATTALEYPAVFVTAALCGLALVAARPWSRILAYGLGALVPVLLVMHFQHAAFGSAFRPGHLFVENPAFRVYHQRGFFGADSVHLDAAARLLTDPRLGLFTTTPFFVLAPLGFAAARKSPDRRFAAGFALVSVLALYLPVVCLSNWDGGWVIGPRYLVTVLPFVGWLAGHGAADVARGGGLRAGVPVGLALASLVTAVIPSLYYPHLPPEVRAPFADLYAPLIRAGVAPDNLGLAAGLPMAWSMAPVLLFAAFTLASPLRHAADRWRAFAFAIPVAFAAASPAFAVSDRPPLVETAQNFVLSIWSPTPSHTVRPR